MRYHKKPQASSWSLLAIKTQDHYPCYKFIFTEVALIAFIVGYEEVFTHRETWKKLQPLIVTLRVEVRVDQPAKSRVRVLFCHERWQSLLIGKTYNS